MQVKIGSNRVVLLIGRWVIKFPHLILKRPRTKIDVDYIWLTFLAGLIANLTEYYTWLAFRNEPFLVPVRFSIGFFSIQERDFGAKPSWGEVNALLKNLPDGAKRVVSNMDGHHYTPSNLRKGPKGYRFVDYGDKICYRGTSLSTFFVLHHQAIAETFNTSNVEVQQ